MIAFYLCFIQQFFYFYIISLLLFFRDSSQVLATIIRGYEFDYNISVFLF